MKALIKKLSVVSFFVFVLFSSLNAQSIYFCEGVDDDGYPINDAELFSIPDDGGYLYVLVRLPFEIACDEVVFEIYRNGDYDNTVYLDTEDDWSWFWKKITFYKSGTYKFYVYDCYDELLTSGRVEIEYY